MQTIIRESIVDALKKTKRKLPLLRLTFVLLGISFGLNVAAIMIYELSTVVGTMFFVHLGIAAIFMVLSDIAERTENKTFLKICNLFIGLMLVAFCAVLVLVGTFYWNGWPGFWGDVLIVKKGG